MSQYCTIIYRASHEYVEPNSDVAYEDDSDAIELDWSTGLCALLGRL